MSQVTNESLLNEFLAYGNAIVSMHVPTADDSVGQFTRMGQYLTDYHVKWNGIAMLLRGKKTVVMDRGEQEPSIDFKALDSAIDEAMSTIKANFHAAYAPGKS